MVEVKKVLSIFDADVTWHKKYDDPTRGRIDTFNHLSLDPRIIAARGAADAHKVAEKLREMWRSIMEVVRD
jgi:hypothetical protein